MKKFELLINETLQVESLEELESAADIFDFHLSKGYYNRVQAIEFNKQYWNKKNSLICQGIQASIKDLNSIDLFYIVSKAPIHIKENKPELIAYVNRIKKNLRGKKIA